MKIKKNTREIAEGDLTPMIDMTFQLIAFFMVLINFTQAEQDQRIKLPLSELAKPPEAPLENAVTLQIFIDNKEKVAKGIDKEEITVVRFDGDDYNFVDLKKRLIVERQARSGPNDEADAENEITVIIRGDMDVQAGKVQELIKLCQDVKFEKFALRAKQEVKY
ncbi:MAG: biopolymer transporter ExbD [Blastopirellula sp.]|nr:MAG: biopolymer transporter ExbD [Blastopirellula sp.]